MMTTIPLTTPSPVFGGGGAVIRDGGGEPQTGYRLAEDHDLQAGEDSRVAFPLRRGLPRHLPRMTGEGETLRKAPHG